MKSTVTKIPKHLQKYVVNQQYEKYTAIDQAVWRYVMRQNHHFLKESAHPAYTGGLKSSGISIEKIPNVHDMNDALSPFGWSAANIDGFIPGVVFFDFQAHGVLPIASDIRKLENIQYTPAPDIIHEAAGHAPILVDEKFSEYVKLFGNIGSKALATSEEHELFEATRAYSNLLETGTATDEEIAAAKALFEEKQANVTELSEAEQISRLYWWTVEYGLIGTMEEPKIYGAGLLSSVAEGRSSLTDSVEKRPFDLQNVIETGFDITKPQPQLFVCESFEQLIEAVKEFAGKMAFHKGGTESLEKALRSNHTATIQYDSGVQLTGTVSTILKDSNGEAIYIRTKGPSALAYNHKELPGHGKGRHGDGFGAPIGRLKKSTCPLGEIEIGKEYTLQYESGVTVTGIPQQFLREQDRMLVISFENCTVSFNDEILFHPEWGMFDLVVGETITSVFAGAADSEQFYADMESLEQKPWVQREETTLEKLYSKVRALRETVMNHEDREEGLKKVFEKLSADFSEDWLLRVEIFELMEQYNVLSSWKNILLQQLVGIQTLHPEFPELIQRGLRLAKEKGL
ncbi:aromatic amino acid hydroxylase [Neobacillus sp. NRS-1170]|uniref:aromatic amino acid hydroxylase n=1 Tax=Neobacillus sp. NRS-1170 TaxID=3233898 RepID=UPI003D2D5058